MFGHGVVQSKLNIKLFYPKLFDYFPFFVNACSSQYQRWKPIGQSLLSNQIVFHMVGQQSQGKIIFLGLLKHVTKGGKSWYLTISWGSYFLTCSVWQYRRLSPITNNHFFLTRNLELGKLHDHFETSKAFSQLPIAWFCQNTTWKI